MMGMGSVMLRVPQMQQMLATSFPGAVVGAMSPYPVLVIVMIAQYRVWTRVTLHVTRDT